MIRQAVMTGAGRRIALGLGLAAMTASAAMAADVTVSGTATYRERMLLPQGAVLEVRLEDQSLADASSELVARTERGATTSPTAFSLTFDASALAERHVYGWRASIRLGERLLFTTDTFMPFDPAVTEGVTLPMVRVSEVAAALPLEGRWLAEDIDGGGVVDNAQTTLEIGEGRVGGRGGCNSYGGAVEIEGDRIRIGPVASTEMACAPALMNQEQRFYEALAAVRSFTIDAERQKLSLSDEAGKVRVVLSRMD